MYRVRQVLRGSWRRIADHGDFGDVCLRSFVDQMLILSNSGRCSLTIGDIASSVADFVVPEVLSYPIVVAAAGGSLHVPIRFAPTSLGAKSGVITIQSDDPKSEKSIRVSGTVPSGKLAVIGSTCIGGVKAGLRRRADDRQLQRR